MSVSTEVQRTLVKSPPELWAELSNPEALGRHLGELGEIRITGVEPETKVEWATDGASGVVHLKQSGWGTKVTLSVTRTAPADDESSEPEAIAEPEPVPTEPGPGPRLDAGPKPRLEPAAKPPEPAEKPKPETAVEPEPQLDALAVEPEPEPAMSPEPIAQPKSQLGFFARMFRRRKRSPHELVAAHPEPEAAAEFEPALEIEVVALATPEPIYPSPPDEPAADLAAELASMEAQMEQETAELLTGVLDRLGAAHHRPFSRG